MEKSDMETLGQYYDMKDKGDCVHLFCKICKAGFSLKKTSQSVGNLLALLDHHAGCEDKKEAING